mgnify:CR=1 FL=1
MVAGDPECYPVMFVYTPDGFPHKTGPFNGFGRYYEYFFGFQSQIATARSDIVTRGPRVLL